MNGAPDLSWWDLLIASCLLFAAGGLSLALRLGVARRLFTAASRTVIQLTALGFVLRFVFEGKRPELVAAVAAVMITAASHAAVRRSGRSFRGALPLAFVALVVSALATLWVVTQWVVGAEPWWTPRVMIPLLGMILGNGLTGISLCLDELLTRLTDRAAEVETDLAAGASRWEAARGPVREALRRGLIPIMNAMSVAGLVSLPGMMTGQILAGASPFQAARYQVVVMFMIAAATSGGSIIMALLVTRRLFDDGHRLRSDLVHRIGS